MTRELIEVRDALAQHDRQITVGQLVDALMELSGEYRDADGDPVLWRLIGVDCGNWKAHKLMLHVRMDMMTDKYVISHEEWENRRGLELVAKILGHWGLRISAARVRVVCRVVEPPALPPVHTGVAVAIQAKQFMDQNLRQHGEVHPE